MRSTALSTAGRPPVRRKRPNRPSVDNAPRLLASVKRVPVQTYLLHPEGAMSEPLRHFIDRAQRVGHMPLDTQRLA